jgi:hypothetical protein
MGINAEAAAAWGALAATYVVHSTILLGLAWLFESLVPRLSHALTERLWKYASVAGVLTVVIQWSCSWPPTAIKIELAGHGWNPPTINASPAWIETRDAAEGIAAGPHDSSVLPRAIADLAGAPDAAARGEAGMSNARAARGTMPAAGDSSFSGDGEPLAGRWPVTLNGAATLGLVTLAYLVCLCIGMGICVTALRYARLRYRLRAARPASDGALRDILDDYLRQHGIRRPVRILVSTACAEPMTTGFFQGAIVVPATTSQRLERDEIQALFAHELAHVVRLDVWWLWVGQLLCLCLPIQPMNFLARRRGREAAEYLCDEWAVQHGIRGATLARCLTRIAAWRFEDDASLLAAAAGGSGALLVQRVERLLAQPLSPCRGTQPHTQWACSAMGAAIVALLAVAAPRIVMPAHDATRSGPGEPAIAAPGHAPAPVHDAAWIEQLQRVDDQLGKLDERLVLAEKLLADSQLDAAQRSIAEQFRVHMTRIRALRDQIRLSAEYPR